MTTRIIIFDNNTETTDKITRILNDNQVFQVVAAFDNTSSCVDDVISTQPDIILMEIETPGICNIAAVSSLSHDFPHIPILIQTDVDDDYRVFDSIIAGAKGYLLKSQLACCLRKFLQELKRGGSPMSPKISRSVLSQIQHQHCLKAKVPEADHKISPREKEVLRELVQGKSYKMISYELNISYETVRSHVKNLSQKLNATSITKLVANALQQHIV